jgi:hypothetical protein
MQRRSTPDPRLKTLAGERRQVWNGRAARTTGGLQRRDLVQNRRGKIVSRKKSIAGRRASKPLDLWRKCLSEAAAINNCPFHIAAKGTAVYRYAKKCYVERMSTGATGRRSTGRRSTGRTTGRRSTGRRSTGRTTGRRSTGRHTGRATSWRTSAHTTGHDQTRHNDEHSDCAICMESSDEPRKHCQCGHSFHARCLNRWLQTNDTCPLCRGVC